MYPLNQGNPSLRLSVCQSVSWSVCQSVSLPVGAYVSLQWFRIGCALALEDSTVVDPPHGQLLTREGRVGEWRPIERRWIVFSAYGVGAELPTHLLCIVVLVVLFVFLLSAGACCLCILKKAPLGVAPPPPPPPHTL